MPKPNPELIPDEDPFTGFVPLLMQINNFKKEASNLGRSNTGYFFSLERLVNEEWFDEILLCRGDIAVQEHREDAVELLIPFDANYTRFLLRPHIVKPGLRAGLVEVNQHGAFKLGPTDELASCDFGWLDKIAINPESNDDGEQSLFELGLRLSMEYEVQPRRGKNRFHLED